MANHLFDEFRANMPARAAPFVVTSSGQTVSYGDLLDRTAAVACELAMLGVKPGDRVAVQVDKSVEALFLYLGCVRVGAIFLPLNVDYTLAELEYFIADARPRLLVCSIEKEGALGPLASKHEATLRTLGTQGDGTLLQDIAERPNEFRDVDSEASDPAAILYTSGTTGRSKGAVLTHENLASNARTLARIWHFDKDDILLHALPIFHAHGLFTATNTILMSGGSMIFLPRFDPEEVLRLLPRATAMMGVPTFYTRLLNSPGLDRETTAGIRLFVSGSAPLLAETHAAWWERTGHVILERYGMTETNMNTSNPYDGERIPGSVGMPLPDVDVRIVDSGTRKALPAGEIGMIEVKGPNVFQGYWNKPEITASELHSDGFFTTGDLGYVDDKGYVYIVGRSKDLIISGGYNVYPREVEDELNSLEPILESAVIGLPHPDFGECVTSLIVPRPGAEIDEAALISVLRSRLAAYKLPKRFIIVDSLPRNTMGKVPKNELRKLYAGLYAQ